MDPKMGCFGSLFWGLPGAPIWEGPQDLVPILKGFLHIGLREGLKKGPQNEASGSLFWASPGPANMAKITLTAVWTLQLLMGFGPHFGALFWGYPPQPGPHIEQVLMGKSFACPHVYRYCCSGGGPKMGYLGSPNMGSPGLVDMG